MFANALILFSFVAADWNSDAIGDLSSANSYMTEFLQLWPTTSDALANTTLVSVFNSVAESMGNEYRSFGQDFASSTPSAELLSAYKAAVPKIENLFAAVENTLDTNIQYADELDSDLLNVWMGNAQAAGVMASFAPDCSYYDSVWLETIGTPLASVFDKAASMFAWPDYLYAPYPACTPSSTTTAAASSTSAAGTTASPSSTYRCLVKPTGTAAASTSTKYIY